MRYFFLCTLYRYAWWHSKWYSTKILIKKYHLNIIDILRIFVSASFLFSSKYLRECAPFHTVHVLFLRFPFTLQQNNAILIREKNRLYSSLGLHYYQDVPHTGKWW